MALAAEGLDEQILRLLHLEAPPRRHEPLAGDARNAASIRRVKCASAWWANTCSSRTLTRALREALVHGGLRQSAARGHRMDRSGRNRFAGTRPSGCCAMSTAFWFPADSASAASQGWFTPFTYARENKIPFFGICLGMQCATIEYARQVSRTRTCRQHGVRSLDAESRDLQIARTARRGRNGRHDAARRVAVQTRARLVRRTRLTARSKSPSAIAIATNSIAITRKRSPTPASASPAARPTASTSKSSRFPIIPGSSAASSIRNSNPSLLRRIRFSPRSFAPAWGIAARDLECCGEARSLRSLALALAGARILGGFCEGWGGVGLLLGSGILPPRSKLLPFPCPPVQFPSRADENLISSHQTAFCCNPVAAVATYCSLFLHCRVDSFKWEAAKDKNTPETKFLARFLARSSQACGKQGRFRIHLLFSLTSYRVILLHTSRSIIGSSWRRRMKRESFELRGKKFELSRRT